MSSLAFVVKSVESVAVFVVKSVAVFVVKSVAAFGVMPVAVFVVKSVTVFVVKSVAASFAEHVRVWHILSKRHCICKDRAIMRVCIWRFFSKIGLDFHNF